MFRLVFGGRVGPYTRGAASDSEGNFGLEQVACKNQGAQQKILRHDFKRAKVQKKMHQGQGRFEKYACALVQQEQFVYSKCTNKEQ